MAEEVAECYFMVRKGKPWYNIMYMANIVKLDPRQIKALALYKDPSSETFGNLKQSMIRAGFKENYSDMITGQNPRWLQEGTRQDVEAIKQAEDNLRKYNSIKVDILDSDNKNAIDIAKLQVDVSKFILKTLAKQKYSDNEDKTLPDVQINIVNYSDVKPPVVTDAEIIK